MLRLASVGGSPYIGVYCAGSEELALVPATTPRSVQIAVAEALDAEPVPLMLGGATILGALVALNRSGAVVAGFATDAELRPLTARLRVARLREKHNAAGNNILANDRAALVHPGLSQAAIRLIEDTLTVEVLRGSVAGVETVGSCCLVTNQGVLCHPKTSEAERQQLAELFHTPVLAATLNYGTPWLGACAIANSKGATVGETTTPIELGKLEEGLGLL